MNGSVQFKNAAELFKLLSNTYEALKILLNFLCITRLYLQMKILIKT